MKIVFSNVHFGLTVGLVPAGELFSDPSISDLKVFMKCIAIPQYATKDNTSLCVDLDTGQLHKFGNGTKVVERHFSLVEKNKT